MDQEVNNRSTELLWELLANPLGRDGSHAYNLHQLIADYPQSGILRALLAHTTEGENIKEAAAYINPRALYKLTHDPENLPQVSAAQIIKLTGQPAASYFHSEDHTTEGGDELLLAPWLGEDDLSAHDIRPSAPHEYDIYSEFNFPAEIPEQPAAEEPVVSEEPAAEIKEKPQEIPEFTEESVEQAEDLPAVIEQPHTEPEDEPIDEITDLPPLTQSEDRVLEQIPYNEINVEEPAAEPEEEPVAYHESTPQPAEEPAPAEQEEVKEDHIVEQFIPIYPPEPEITQPIEDDVFDEIVSIDDINLAYEDVFAKSDAEEAQPEPYREPFADALTEEAAATSHERKVDMNDEAEKLILNNIVSTDFFVFDRAFGDHKETAHESVAEPAPAAEPAPVTAPQPGPQLQSQPRNVAPAESAPVAQADKPAKKEEPYINVSKYNDEKMPYSFMWWLDKTRKEHSGIYQPYVEFKLDTTQNIKRDVVVPDELQQQYYENIFHNIPVEELEKGAPETAIEFDPKRKEDKIIERFIQEVPQIKPQTGEKLDNENKAKKSSEDQAELVTETLAQIYIDQMLYPKAIATYKKLMLKFPEKSRYFASQIQQLEKKTN